jgi:hypothetical protein
MCLLSSAYGFGEYNSMQNLLVPDPENLANRYVALWNEDDGAARRDSIHALWADDGWHVAPTITARGFEELEARVARSHQRWIVENACRFRLKEAPAGHHNVLRIGWEMIDPEGSVESIGTEILVFNETGKISCVYQFIEQ